jgi:hypothetical protein
MAELKRMEKDQGMTEPEYLFATSARRKKKVAERRNEWITGLC